MELKLLSPLSLIVLDNFVRLKIPFSGFTFLNSPCMIVQRKIATIRNKISRSFASHRNRKTKNGKVYFINILVPSLRTWGIWKWICSQKKDRNINNTNFYIFCFCFPFKMLLVLLLWFYHVIVTNLLTYLMILDVKETFRRKWHVPSVLETRYFILHCFSWRNIYMFC